MTDAVYADDRIKDITILPISGSPILQPDTFEEAELRRSGRYSPTWIEDEDTRPDSGA